MKSLDIISTTMNTKLRIIPITPAFFAGQKNTSLTWLGMAGALINARGVILLIDPLIVSREKDGKADQRSGLPVEDQPADPGKGYPQCRPGDVHACG